MSSLAVESVRLLEAHSEAFGSSGTVAFCGDLNKSERAGHSGPVCVGNEGYNNLIRTEGGGAGEGG